MEADIIVFINHIKTKELEVKELCEQYVALTRPRYYLYVLNITIQQVVYYMANILLIEPKYKCTPYGKCWPDADCAPECNPRCDPDYNNCNPKTR